MKHHEQVKYGQVTYDCNKIYPIAHKAQVDTYFTDGRILNTLITKRHWRYIHVAKIWLREICIRGQPPSKVPY